MMAFYLTLTECQLNQISQNKLQKEQLRLSSLLFFPLCFFCLSLKSILLSHISHRLSSGITCWQISTSKLKTALSLNRTIKSCSLSMLSTTKTINLRCLSMIFRTQKTTKTLALMIFETMRLRLLQDMMIMLFTRRQSSNQWLKLWSIFVERF